MGYIKTPWVMAVRIEMERQGLTYSQLAEAVGRTKNLVISVCNGTLVSRPTRSRISEYLGIPEEISEIHVTYK